MTRSDIVIIAFAVLILGLMLPIGHGLRSALFLALVTLAVLTFLGGGMQYFLHFF